MRCEVFSFLFTTIDWGFSLCETVAESLCWLSLSRWTWVSLSVDLVRSFFLHIIMSYLRIGSQDVGVWLLWVAEFHWIQGEQTQHKLKQVLTFFLTVNMQLQHFSAGEDFSICKWWIFTLSKFWILYLKVSLKSVCVIWYWFNCFWSSLK
jgi:hypothetical protein